jgi:plastocyanin
VRSGSQRLAVAASAAALVALAASGCGREDPDLVTGKQLFVERCGACHTLARAGTTGVNGPDLDEAFGPARGDGLGPGTVEGITLAQIDNPLRNSGMPAELVTGRDARAVAAYVAAVAGQSGEDRGRLASAGAPDVSDEPIEAEGGELRIDANPTGALAFESTKAEASPGTVEILSMNESPIQHNIALEGPGGEVTEGPVVGTGGTSKLQATLKPGRYRFVCTVPGHEEGGMKGTLTVRR